MRDERRLRPPRPARYRLIPASTDPMSIAVGQRTVRRRPLTAGVTRSKNPQATTITTGVAQLNEVRLLRGLELGLLAAQPALGLGDLHALPCSRWAVRSRASVEQRSYPMSMRATGRL